MEGRCRSCSRHRRQPWAGKGIVTDEYETRLWPRSVYLHVKTQMVVLGAVLVLATACGRDTTAGDSSAKSNAGASSGDDRVMVAWSDVAAWEAGRDAVDGCRGDGVKSGGSLDSRPPVSVFLVPNRATRAEFLDCALDVRGTREWVADAEATTSPSAG